MKRIALAAVCAALVFSGAVRAASAESHEGYYFPQAGSTEEYVARATVLPEASRALRLGFVSEMTRQQLALNYPPQYAVFAKGDEAEKLIVVALNDEIFRTLFRARGVLAQLTAQARATPFFKDRNVDDVFTFFDLLKLMGFAQLTISDGQTWAHRVEFK